MSGQSYKTSAAKTLVVGLGTTGLSCARYLHARGVPVAVTDTRAEPPGLAALRDELPAVTAFLGGFDPEAFAAASRLVVSPGVPLSEPPIQAAIARGIPVLGDIELFARAAAAPLCAITGSNGKSTVTSLMGEMARLAGWRVAVGGNLGEPALDLLDPQVELYVLELSSFQLDTTDWLGASVATVLNLSPDHLDRHADLAAYAAAKARIFRGVGTAVVNRDDPQVLAMLPPDRPALGFTLAVPASTGDVGVRERAGRAWLCRGEQWLLPADELTIRGRHNLANAAAALALAGACGIPDAAACEALRRFEGLPHRSVLIAEQAGVRWFDDSKGTNPGATVAALRGLAPDAGAGRVVLIAGGDGKGADFAPLRDAVRESARAVVLLGRDAPRIAAVLEETVPLIAARDMAEAVQRASEVARAGDAVLLSPACASFDLFADYRQRGQVFTQAVRALMAGVAA